MNRSIGAVLAILLATAPALAYKLVARGRPVMVAKSALTVVPAIDWNRADKRPGRHAENWTLDGLPLNELTFYGGIAPGQALFREIDRREKPLPRFARSMLAPDIVRLFESSHRLAASSPLFTVDAVMPAMFAGRPGFRFTYSFVQQGDDVRRTGEATGAVIGGRLYLISFEAPTIHYFARNVGDYRALVATATIPTITTTTNTTAGD